MGYFYILASVNAAAMNMGIPTSLWGLNFSSFRYTQKWDYWLYGSSIFAFLRNLHTVLHCGWSNLHFHKKCTRISFSSDLANIFYLYLSVLVITILADVRSYLIVILICIFLMFSDGEHIFMSSFEKCLFSSSPHFWSNCSFRVELYKFLNFWILSWYYINDFKIFVPSLGCLFNFADSLLCCAEEF